MKYGQGTGDLSDPQMGELHTPVDWWRGEDGDAYTGRNEITKEGTANLVRLWADILRHIPSGDVDGVLEVGANIGRNLIALDKLGIPRLYAIEPNEKARKLLPFHCYGGTAQKIECINDAFDLAFTSGVLIHVPKADVVQCMRELIRVSRRWIVMIEYFSVTPRRIKYRGDGLLRAEDYGEIMAKTFPVKPVACGFAWKRLTGLDNLTWWLFEK